MKEKVIEILGIVTDRYYEEPVTKEAAIAKIEKSCEALQVPFLPELVAFNEAIIHGGAKLTFHAKIEPLELATGIVHGNPKYRDLIKAYEPEFAIDHRWYGSGLVSCEKVFYTTGIDILTTLNAIHHLDRGHYLTGVLKLEELISESQFTKEEQIDLIYFS